MKAYLMNHDVNLGYGVTEWWKTEEEEILCVKFYADIGETMAFPYDMEKDRVQHWNPLLMGHKDMTGGRAIRKLGYEPVEGDGSDDTD